MNQLPESSPSAVRAIAAVLPPATPPFPLGYDDATEVRELRASAWIDIGLTDPAEVARWTNAGVHSAAVARDAIRAGYEPEDPWVRKSAPESPRREAGPLTSPSRLTAWRNRRAARKAWELEQAEEMARRAKIRADFTAAANLIDSEGIGSGMGVAGLELREMSGSEVLPAQVIAAFDQVMLTYRALQQSYRRDLLSDDEFTEISAHTRGSIDLVLRHLSPLAPDEQTTMRGELMDAGAWLSSPE